MGRKRNLVTAYLKEEFLYGGMVATRGDVIADLQQMGYDQRYIDRYLQGLALGKRIRGAA